MNELNGHIHLDPNPDGLGGGAAAADAPALGGAAPASVPQFDPTSFKTELLNEFRQELGGFRQQFDGRFREFDSRLPQPSAKEDKAPSLKDFYNSNGEMDAEGFEKYQDARIAYNLKQHRAEWEREQAEARSREDYEARQNSVLEAHASRQDAYHKANPDYNPDFPVAFRNAAVTLAVADSEYSAHIHHFFQKNPDKLNELRGIESSKGAIAALRYIGRLETQFEQKQNAPVAKPTRAAFGGTGAGNKPVQRPLADIVKDWRD